NPRGEEAAGQRALQRGFGEPSQSLQVVLYKADGDVSGAVEAAGAALRGVPHVVSVGDYRADASWLSGDRHTTFLMVGFDADDSTVQGLTDQVRERALGALPGFEVHVTGAPALDRDLNVQSQRDAELAEMIAFPLLLIVLFVVFRSVVAMLVPLVL